ncbi:FkbM family methyltransferase [Anatilimnocola aggregata]|nr:FkbM family methyltransferase [Anatilimnocola aggregata]
MANIIPDLKLQDASQNTVFCVRTCRHGPMVFLPRDEVIGRALEVYGEFAESENRLMAELVRPGDVVIDVGANVGTVALALAAKVGAQGKLILFEPQPLVAQALCATLTFNGITFAQVRREAVGKSAGEVLIPIPGPDQAGNFGAVRVTSSGPGERTPLVTLDSLALARCRLIKIDVEGMDFDVLLGATDLIERTRPHIYMEAKEGPATAQAIGWLQARSYDCYWHFAAFFSPDNFRGVKENLFPGTGDINLLAIPRETGIQSRLPRILSPQARWRDDYQAFLALGSG